MIFQLETNGDPDGSWFVPLPMVLCNYTAWVHDDVWRHILTIFSYADFHGNNSWRYCDIYCWYHLWYSVFVTCSSPLSRLPMRCHQNRLSLWFSFVMQYTLKSWLQVVKHVSKHLISFYLSPPVFRIDFLSVNLFMPRLSLSMRFQTRNFLVVTHADCVSWHPILPWYLTPCMHTYMHFSRNNCVDLLCMFCVFFWQQQSSTSEILEQNVTL